MATSILWLRRDLRRHDHPALAAAAERGDVLPLYVADPRLALLSPVRWRGLEGVLGDLREAYDGALVVRLGDPVDVVARVAAETGARSVHVTPDATAAGRHTDAAVAEALGDVPLVGTASAYAVAPGGVRNKQGDPYQVFTPFARAWREHGWPPPATDPRDLRFARPVEGDTLPAAPPGTPEPDAAGERPALRRWAAFLDDGLDTYAEDRDRPDLDGTSRLSAALRWGTVHPRTLLADLAGRQGSGAERFVTELAWREFYADVLWHHPRSAWEDLRPLDVDYDPVDDPGTASLVAAWREGRTGYPFVDAGMRQLLATGWMHNRVRMVVASFLAKHLHVWWPVGARHFRAHLADFDLASNSHGWQWVAGTGTDAAPYFRVFNPVVQGKRFDPDGGYVRRWVPELAHLPGVKVHEPWRHAGGYAHGYPPPVVEHAAARAEALARYQLGRRRASDAGA